MSVLIHMGMTTDVQTLDFSYGHFLGHRKNSCTRYFWIWANVIFLSTPLLSWTFYFLLSFSYNLKETLACLPFFRRKSDLQRISFYASFQNLLHFVHGFQITGLPLVLLKRLSKIQGVHRSWRFMKRCPWATIPSSFIGYLPKLIIRAIFQGLSTGHLLMIAQRVGTKDFPQVTLHGLSATGQLSKLVHSRPPSKACPPQATFQDLSTADHLPRLAHHRPLSKDCPPQAISACGSENYITRVFQLEFSTCSPVVFSIQTP